MVVGRKEECDLRLEHKSVSKMHCVIVKTDGLLLLRDLGSTNGTRVNGQRIRRAALLPNDQLSIANLQVPRLPRPRRARPAGGRTSTPSSSTPARWRACCKGTGARRANGSNGASLPIQPNLLPDVYPEDPNAKPE